jgi:hypothetical protein
MKKLLVVLVVIVAAAVAFADYQAQDALCADAAFVVRVRQSIVKSAISIQNESDATQNHISRAQYAYNVLHDPQKYATQMCSGVVSDDASYSTDAALDTRVSAVWNAYAMVDP